MAKILLFLLLTLISAGLYRLGGWGKPFKSWLRDWLCPACIYGALLLWWQPSVWWGWLLLLVAYGLTGGALTTYLDSIFGYDNFYASGFLVGLGAFPLMFCGVAWWTVLVRAVLTGILWGVLCDLASNDWVEELGRGSIIVLTVPLLLI